MMGQMKELSLAMRKVMMREPQLVKTLVILTGTNSVESSVPMWAPMKALMREHHSVERLVKMKVMLLVESLVSM